MQPGTEFGGYRIEAIEREDAGAAVLIARNPQEDHSVALHIAGEPLGALSTVRFLERAHRLGGVAHPHLLGVYDARTLEGRAVAVAQAPPGRRLDDLLAGGRLAAGRAMRIARQVASAVDALEQAGAEPPPLTAERIWVDGAGDAHLDGLDARIALPAASSSAAVAWLVADMAERVPRRLETVLARARDGAYLSASQFAGDLRAVEAEAAWRRRELALALALVAAALVAMLLLLTLR